MTPSPRWRWMHELLAAPHCLLCAGPTQALVCADCRAALPWNEPACPRCARPLTVGPPRTCPDCLRRAPPFDAALCAFRYETPVSGAIQRLKYSADFLAARWLADALAERLQHRTAPLPDCLLPVPLHRWRQLRRGYNQSQQLARIVAARLHLPLEAGLARRLRATEDQIGKTAVERRRNLRGAFAVSAAVSGKAVALIDDVMTTGSTAAELARACRRAGASGVEIWAVARVP